MATKNVIAKFDKLESMELAGDLFYIWEAAKSNAGDTLGKGHISIGLNHVEYTDEFKVMAVNGIECSDYAGGAQEFFDEV
jgi:hypothetical protein